jgi:hypothetical protein
VKYIVMVRKTGSLRRELPILFPNELVHQHVAKALLGLPGNPYGFENRVASAGDVVFSRVACSGRSESLNIATRGKEDETLIWGVEYGFGVK